MCPVYNKRKDSSQGQDAIRLTTFRLKGFVWQESAPGSSVLPGFTFASSVNEKGVELYLGKKLRANVAVRVALEKEKAATTYRGVVLWSERYSLEQRFLGHEALSYRIGIKFLFGSEAERQRYLDYVKELHSRALSIKPGMRF